MILQTQGKTAFPREVKAASAFLPSDIKVCFSILRIVKSLPGSVSFVYKPTSPKSIAPNQLHIQLPHTKPAFPLHWIILGPGTRQLETNSIAQSPLELFKLVNPKPFTLLCSSFPKETPIKVLGHSFTPFCLLTTPELSLWPCVAYDYPLSLGSESIINFILSDLVLSSWGHTNLTISYPTPTCLEQNPFHFL